MKKCLILYLFIGCILSVHSQDPELDSLLKILKGTPEDTNKLKLLDAIADIAPDGEWQQYSEQMAALAQKLIKSNTAATQLAGKKYYSISLNNTAFGYFEKGDFNNAIDFFSRSLKISREIGDNGTVALGLSNLGAIYDRQGEAEKAIEVYRQALNIQIEIKNKEQMIGTLLNIGSLYKAKNIPDSALVYYMQSLNLAEQINFKSHTTAILYANLGSIMESKQEFSKATDYFTKGLKLSETIGDKSGKSGNTRGLANIYFKTIGPVKALPYAKQALAIAIEIENLRDIQRASELLKRIYQKQGNFKEAFEMYALETSMRDSLNRKENDKAVLRHQFQYAYDLKEATAKAEQEKKDGIAKAELRKQKVQKMAFLGGFAVMVLFAGVFFRQRNKIGREKKRSEDLLLNILPEEVAEELKEKGTADARLFENVTVFFSDFKGFTTVSEKLSPQELVNELHECFTAFDNIMHKYGIEKIKTVGDAYLAVCGLPTANTNHAADMVKAALEIKDYMKTRSEKELSAIRIGIHSGHVVAGIVGVKKFAYDIWGDTVNTAARMEQNGEPGKINISEATYELVKDKFHCNYRGEIEAKNKGKLKMYFVEMN